MKAWLRAVMAALFAGGMVYLLWREEKHSRRRNIRRMMQDGTVDKIRTELEEHYRKTDPLPALEAAVEDLAQSQNRLIDSHDDLMLTMGRPKYATDPLGAEFRRAAKRGQSKNEQ
jgi:hypothetical protein